MKKKIRIILIMCLLAIICICGYTFFRYQNTSSERLPDRYDDVIEQIHSTVDKDSDGIDDQIDILQGALNYIASKPKYKSKYYQTGYPNDEYGVCTDVVANALNNAGYDLMILIQEDIKANPNDYNIDEPDINIDLLCSENYICHFLVVRKTLIDQIGMLNKEFDGAQDYDFVFTIITFTRSDWSGI